MTFGGLLTQTVTVYARVTDGVDEDNNPILIDASLGQWPCLLQIRPYRAGEEVEGGRDTSVNDFGLTIGPDARGLLPSFDALARVDVDGRSYEVTGPPQEARIPRRGVHRLRVEVRSFTG